MLSVKVQSNIPHCPPLFAAKSLVSSSIGNECTFFQTLDDHITQPVLFIPETHLSSLQRMVGPHLTTVLPPPIHILAGNRAGTSKAGEKKKLWESMRWEKWEGGGIVVPEKVRWNTGLRSDELIGVETRHKYKQLQLLTPRLSYERFHRNTCTHAPGETALTPFMRQDTLISSVSSTQIHLH